MAFCENIYLPHYAFTYDLKPQSTLESPGVIIKIQIVRLNSRISDSITEGWGQVICISHVMLMVLVQRSHCGNHWFMQVPCFGMPLSYSNVFTYRSVYHHSDTAFIDQSLKSQMEGISIPHILSNTLFLPWLSLL